MICSVFIGADIGLEGNKAFLMGVVRMLGGVLMVILVAVAVGASGVGVPLAAIPLRHGPAVGIADPVVILGVVRVECSCTVRKQATENKR